MSWSIQLVGSRAAVKAALDKRTDLPATVSAAIAEICSDPKPYRNGLLVKGFGHNNDGKSCESSIGSLVVEPVELVGE